LPHEVAAADRYDVAAALPAASGRRRSSSTHYVDAAVAPARPIGSTLGFVSHPFAGGLAWLWWRCDALCLPPAHSMTFLPDPRDPRWIGTNLRFVPPSSNQLLSQSPPPPPPTDCSTPRVVEGTGRLRCAPVRGAFPVPPGGSRGVTVRDAPQMRKALRRGPSLLHSGNPFAAGDEPLPSPSGLRRPAVGKRARMKPRSLRRPARIAAAGVLFARADVRLLRRDLLSLPRVA